MSHTWQQIWLIVLVCTFACCAHGQVLTITITMQSDPSGVMLISSGTSNTTMAFGNAQAFGGSVPSGAIKADGTSSWTVSSLFDLKVTCTALGVSCTGSNSPSFALLAALQSSDSIDSYAVAGNTLNLVLLTISATTAYSTFTPYNFTLTIPFSKATGLINNAVLFVAIPN